MNQARIKLIKELIKKRIYDDINQIINIANNGFDVHVKVEFKEIEQVLSELIQEEQKKQMLNFNLISDPKLLDEKFEEFFHEPKVIQPTVFIHPETIRYGMGFIVYKIQSAESLLSSPANAIEKILEHFGLGLFIDVFDADIFSKLKQIAKMMGINHLIDAVVQTAYLGGFKGNYGKALEYLDHILINSDEIYSKDSVSLEKCAENFFAYIILQGHDAHSFVKSALSFYTVKRKGFSMSKASQMLQISRTTLQEHLKLAEKLGVSNFFEGYRQKTI